MKKPPHPEDETSRLAALHGLQLLDTLPEPALDDLTQLAAQLCGTPISLVSLVDEKRQWFKSKVGLSIAETPRDVAFCAHAINRPELFIVPDAAQDERFADNPLVTDDPHVRFYAGAPLVTADGHAIGTLCVMDRVPRQLSAGQCEALQALGRQVMAQLELRRQTRELQAQESRLRLAVEAAHLGMFDWDRVADVITWDRRHEELWGYRPGEFTGGFAAVTQRVHPDDRAGLEAEVARCIAKRQAFHHEFRVVWPDGSEHWVESVGEFTFDDHGKAQRMRGVIMEVTARKTAEATLRRARADLERAQHLSHTGSWEYAVAGPRITWSDETYRIFGLEPKSGPMTYERLIALVHPEDRAKHDGFHARLLAARPGEFIAPFEYRVPRQDGGITHVQVQVETGFDAAGKLVRAFGTVQDITASRLAEEKLRASEERYRALVEQAADAIFITGPDGKLLEANSRASEMFGYTRPEFVGLPVASILPEFERKRQAEAFRRILQGERVRTERQYRRRDGTMFPGELLAGRTETGLIVGIVRDISERKQAEAALREREEQLRLYAEHSPAAVAMFDRNMRYLVASRSWIESYRLEGQSIVGRSHYEVFPEIPDRWKDIHRRCLDGAVERCEEEAFPRADGTIDWIHWEIRPWREAGGTIGGIIMFTENITDRKQAEAALRASEASLAAAQARAHLGSWELDLATQTGWWSAEMSRLYYRDPTLPAPSLPEFMNMVHPEDRSLIDAINARVPEATDPIQQEIRTNPTLGPTRVLSVSLEVMRDAAGRAVRVVGTSLDITERKRAELRIQQLNRTYAVLSDINQTIVREPDAAVMLRAACRIAVEKGRFCMAWIGLAESPGARLTIAAHAGATVGTLEIIDALLDAGPGGGRCEFTARALRSGRHAICNRIAEDPEAASWREAALKRGYQSMASLPLVSGENAIGTFNLYADEAEFFDAEEMRLLDELATDISFALNLGRREAERARLGRVIEASLNEIYLFDAETLRYEYVNAGARANIGYPWEDLQDMTPVDLEPEFTVETFRRRLEPLLRREQSKLVFETVHLRADGSLYPVEVHVQLVDQPDHPVFVAIGVDLSERKRAEEALQRNEEQFRILIENASDLITVINHRGVIRYQSPSITRVLGFTPEELVGQEIFSLIHADDVAATTAALQQTVADPAKPVVAEYRVRHHDGQWRSFQSYGRNIPGQADDGFIVVNSRDITETRQLEEQFRQAQKLEAIGQLAGGVAHDFNNLLTVIQGYGSLLTLPGQTPDDIADSARQIVQASERAANLTRQLLAFSRRQVMRTRRIDANEIVTSLTKMLQRIVGEDVRLQLNLHSRPLPIRADPGMLDQVLLNLVVNARDAMPGGGRLFVATGERILSPAEAAAIPEAVAGAYVSLRVTDTGTGIAPEHLARIFEPFFTTKEPGKGTGLGLATVFGIVKQHGGIVDVQSEPGRGATFEILLPALADDKQAGNEIAAAKPARGGSETILLVEDDPSVRLLTRVVLERAGYRVLEAVHGAAALRLVEENNETIHLLFTDIVMPEGVSGHDLATRLQTKNPRLRVIFTSGYSADIAGRELALKEGQNFIQKPAMPHEILATVRQCLDG